MISIFGYLQLGKNPFARTDFVSTKLDIDNLLSEKKVILIA